MCAVVNTPICPLMTQPRPDCPLADEALLGMVVDILEDTNEAYCLVRTHYRYEGYAPKACLVMGNGAAAAWEATAQRVILGKNSCDLHSEPKYQSYPLLQGLTLGGRVAVEGEPEDNWQKVSLPDGRTGYLRPSWLGEYHAAPLALPEEELRKKIVDTALLYRGTHYRWGGKSPLGIDCSGLCSMSYLLNGILIYRDASIEEGFPIHPIDPAEARPGDLLFFPGHVAMCMEDRLFIHSTGHAGSDGVDINSTDPASPLYRKDLMDTLSGAGSYF